MIIPDYKVDPHHTTEVILHRNPRQPKKLTILDSGGTFAGVLVGGGASWLSHHDQVTNVLVLVDSVYLGIILH